MACVRAISLVWVMAVAMVAAIMVVENGRMCSALDMQEAKDSVMTKAKEAKESASSFSSWAYNKISGKLSVDNDMKPREDSTMNKVSDKASDAGEFVSGKLHAVSHSQMTPEKDDSGKFYEKSKKDLGGSYDSLKKEPIIED